MGTDGKSNLLYHLHNITRKKIDKKKMQGDKNSLENVPKI
jgi:hypothetical protein